MKTVAIIPARLASTRLPQKMLREIDGKPLVGWVYEAVASSRLLSDVVVATDSEVILEACRRYGWKAQLTSTGHRSGTERVHEVSDGLAADVYVNVQGDEPLVRPEQIATLLEVMKDESVQVGTVKTACPPEDVHNPNAVKVVTAADGRALYFSRATIPFGRWPVPLLQASRTLCLLQVRARFFCQPARIHAGEKRAARTIALPGKRNLNLCRRDTLRFCGCGYGRGSAAGGRNSASPLTSFFDGHQKVLPFTPAGLHFARVPTLPQPPLAAKLQGGSGTAILSTSKECAPPGSASPAYSSTR